MWRGGGHYEMRGDFRDITDGELPVILHHMNKHDRKAGDKLEIIETGKLSMMEMNLIQEDIFRVDAAGNRVLRLDVAADLKAVPVQWFRDHVQFRGKQTVREWATQTVRGRRAETISAGQKPNQIRIYDKTGHRLSLTMSALRKMTREDRLALMAGDPKGWAIHFETMWGYSPDRIVTRVERQIGGKMCEILRLGHVANLVNLDIIDPYTQLVLPCDVRRGKVGPKTRNNPMFLLACDVLSDRVERDGIDNTKEFLMSYCRNRQAFYRAWKNAEEFVVPKERSEVTRKALLEAFRSTIHRQFKQAA